MQAVLWASWGLPGQGRSAVRWFSECAPGSSVMGVTRELVSSTQCQAPPQTIGFTLEEEHSPGCFNKPCGGF